MNNTTRKNTRLKYVLMLLGAAVIWGFAFTAQSLASGMGAITFNACRSILATIALIPVTMILSGNLKLDKKTVIGGTLSGIFLCLASISQQAGIAYTSPGKAAFITTLYIVIVALLTFLIKKKLENRIIIAVILAVMGLFFICMKPGDSLRDISKGDLLLLLCAFIFSCQILTTDHYVKACNPIKFAFVNFAAYAVLSTILAFIFEKPDISEIKSCMPSILYCGLLSSGVAYTLQMVGQKYLPAVLATICLSFESVFSILGEWIVLGTVVTKREALGCIIMFAAILIAQISHQDIEKLSRKNRKIRKISHNE